MKRVAVIAVFILVLTAMFSVMAAPAAPADTVALIIQADSSETAAQIVTEYGGQVNQHLDIITAVSAEVSESTLALLMDDSRVVVYQNNAVRATDGDDNDDEGGENEDVFAANFPQVVNADDVWEEGVKGKHITVAVVDSGIGKFGWNRGRIKERYDALDNGPRKKDPYGHGSFVAGIIGNKKKDDTGSYMGIAPKVKFVDVRVLDEEGRGEYIDVVEGLNWVLENAEEYNIRVVNLSLISDVASPDWVDPINQAVEQLWDAGIVVVAAAGNSGSDPM
ncbi:MAG: S8 family serine peptidase, partial [Anaerolineae bacterium]